MPKGYVVAHIRVQDNDGYAEFKRMAGPAIAEHDGRVLVRDPDGDHREGSLRGTVVVVEFQDLAAARHFYESEAYTNRTARRIVSAQSTGQAIQLTQISATAIGRSPMKWQAIDTTPVAITSAK